MPTLDRKFWGLSASGGGFREIIPLLLLGLAGDSRSVGWGAPRGPGTHFLET